MAHECYVQGPPATAELLWVISKERVTKSLTQFSILSQLDYTVEPRLTTTRLIPPPRYYGHFILAQKKLSQSFSD